LLENSLVMIKEKALKHRIQLSTDLDGIPQMPQISGTRPWAFSDKECDRIARRENLGGK
jgi:hypothetical protein